MPGSKKNQNSSWPNKKKTGGDRRAPSELVADQPGFSWAITGILIALFMGLAIRALMAPERVKTQIRYALTKVNKDIFFQFEDAYVSLSDGIIPELGIVVKGIHFSSEDPCFGKFSGELTDLRLPISFSHLVRGEFYVHEVEMGDLVLNFKSPIANCFLGSENKPNNRVENQADGKNPGQVESRSEMSDENKLNRLVTGSTQSKEQKYLKPEKSIRNQGAIDEISIQNIKVNYEPLAFTSFEIHKFNLQLKQKEPRQAKISGRLALFGETLSGEYSSKANVEISVFEGPDTKVELMLQGNWREGNYSARFNYAIASRNYDFNGELEHIPLSQLLPLLKKYHAFEEDYNAKQVWASLKIKSSGVDPQPEKMQVKITQFKVEGEIGRLESNSIEVESLKPLKVKPINVQLSGLDFDKLFIFLNRPHPSSTLGHLGRFSGNAYMKNPDNIELIGEHSGLEFIFANKGNRELQVISLITGEMQLLNDRWKVMMNRIRPLEGVFDGAINIRADREWRNLDIELNVDELIISPKVQRLMSSGGEFGPLSGDLSASFRQGHMDALKGVLRLNKFNGDGILAQGTRIKFDTKEKIIAMDVNLNELNINLNSVAGQSLRPIIDESMLTAGSFLLKNPTLKMRTSALDWMEWKSLSAQTPAGKITSVGRWDEAGLLTGAVTVRRESRDVTWEILGKRERPQFSEMVNKK